MGKKRDTRILADLMNIVFSLEVIEKSKSFLKTNTKNLNLIFCLELLEMQAFFVVVLSVLDILKSLALKIIKILLIYTCP